MNLRKIKQSTFLSLILGAALIIVILAILSKIFLFHGETKWTAQWFSMTGDMKFGGKISESTLPATFSYDWGYGEVNSGYPDYVGLIATARIFAPRAGLYRFVIGSDDGSRLSIDGVEAINCNWKYGGVYSENGISINLAAGLHDLRLEYWERTGRARVYFDCDHELLIW